MIILRFIVNVCFLVTGYMASDEFAEKCFDHLGCFSNAPPFYNPIFFPANRVPEDFAVNFLLYTPNNMNDSYNLQINKESIKRSPFNENVPTKILINAYNDGLEDPKDEFFVMKNEFLKNEICNVILVDWGEGNKSPYSQATTNGRKVGALIAYLLTKLKANRNIDFDSVHLIGHSLGAHIAGWAGKRLNKIGRITGLDPAGSFQNTSIAVRLDKTDAKFVDIIHTNIGGFGINQNIGDEDFYPNGGILQTACSNVGTNNYNFINRAIGYGISIFKYIFGIPFDSCSHSIGKEYFTNSINKCRFFGVQCKNYEDFKEGKCTSKTSLVAEMGYHAKFIKGIKRETHFYLLTSDQPPYCLSNDGFTNID